MELRVRELQLNAGKPIVLIHESDAQQLGVRPSDRVHLIFKGATQTAVVDVLGNFLKRGEVAISQDLASKLKVTNGKRITVKHRPVSKGSKILGQGLVCYDYTKSDLKKIIGDIVHNELSEAEIAYFISGVNYCGMSLNEVYAFIQAIVETGQTLHWGTKKVADKHSIGGIPGNRTTPLVVAICAAAGVIMPKTSSRAITSAAGTADTVESLAPVDFSVNDLKKIVKKTGACLAWGGSLGLAPADDKLIQVEKLLNIDPEPQLLASIMAKKIAVGSKYVLIDIPYGPGAKVDKKESYILEKKFKTLARWFKMKLEVVRTPGEQPVGNGIGPSLEMMDILKVLRREPNAPKDLEKKSLFLASKLLEMVGKVRKGQGLKLAKRILDQGKAYAKFKEIIEAQGGSIQDLPKARHRATIYAFKAGNVKSINNRKINALAHILGCPHDKNAGIYLHKHKGDHVKKDEILMDFYSESPYKLQEAQLSYKEDNPFRVE